MKAAAASGHGDAIALAISQIAFAGMQIYIPWLAASRGSMAELAMLSLAQSFVWPLAMLSMLQLRTLYVARGEKALFPLFVQLRLGMCVLLIACSAITAAFLGQGYLLFAVAVALALIKSVEAVADIMQSELYRSLNVRPAARSQTWRCAIFIGIYTIVLVLSDDLVIALTAALACIAAWVLAVDMEPRAFWREVLAQGIRLDSILPTVRVGLGLSAAVALTSLSVMVGRWAALRAGDTQTIAAAALAGTVASVVAVVLSATQQYSLAPARVHLLAGGVPAFRRWFSRVTSGIHVLMALLALAWVGAAVLVWTGALPFADRLGTQRLQDTVIVLAGCFIAAGWLTVLCLADTVLLVLHMRYATLLLLGVLQVVAATAVSLVLYPQLGWIAIGIAEIVRSLSFIAAVRFDAYRLRTASQAPC